MTAGRTSRRTPNLANKSTFMNSKKRPDASRTRSPSGLWTAARSRRPWEKSHDCRPSPHDRGRVGGDVRRLPAPGLSWLGAAPLRRALRPRAPRRGPGVGPTERATRRAVSPVRLPADLGDAEAPGVGGPQEGRAPALAARRAETGRAAGASQAPAASWPGPKRLSR